MSTQVLTVDQPRPLVNWSKLWLLAIAGFAALSILTLLGMIIWMSLRTGVPGQPSAYTLKNYAALLGDSYTYRVMTTTLIFAAVTIAVSVPLGFIFAWFIERTDIPYKTVAMSVLSIGILFPTFLKAMGWVFLAPSADRRDQYFPDATLRSDKRAAQYCDGSRNRFRARHDINAAGVCDDFGGHAEHESGTGGSRQRSRREPSGARSFA